MDGDGRQNEMDTFVEKIGGEDVEYLAVQSKGGGTIKGAFTANFTCATATGTPTPTG